MARRRSFHGIEGYNGRLDAMQAAFLRIKLRHLDRWTEGRRQVAARYQRLLSPLTAKDEVRLPLSLSGAGRCITCT